MTSFGWCGTINQGRTIEVITRGTGPVIAQSGDRLYMNFSPDGSIQKWVKVRTESFE